MEKENNLNSLLKKGLVGAGAALMCMSTIQPCVVNAAETTTFKSDRPEGFYDTLFEVDKWGDLSVSVLRNNDVYRNVAFCMAKQKYFPTQEGVEYRNNLDPSSWAWGRGDGTYVDQTIVKQVRNIMYAYNFEFNHKLKDYGLEGDTMSLYSATSIALWAVIEGFTPDDIKIQPEASGEARKIAEKQLPLIRDLYSRKDTEGYHPGATLKNLTTNAPVEATIDITSDHVYQLSDENYYYRSPLMSMRPNQKDGVVFDGEHAYEYVVTIEGAPEGSLVTDEKSNVIADGKFGYDLPQGSDFYVYVPIYGVDDGELTVKVDATKLNRMDLQLWTPTSSSGYQDILSNALVSDKASGSTKLRWKVEEKPVTPPPASDKHYGRLEITKVGERPYDVQKSQSEFGELNTIRYREGALPNVGFDFYFNNMITDANGVLHFKNEKISRKPVYTSKEGRIVYSGLPMDQKGDTQYRIEEVTIPSGYAVDDVNTLTTVNPITKTSKVRIVNKMISLDLSIQKTGKDGAALQGAVFGLYTKNAIPLGNGSSLPEGSLVAILTSDERGNISTGNSKLPAAYDYQLKELKAPEGYKLDATVYDVKVDRTNGKATVEKSGQQIGSIPNVAIMSGKIEINKVDISDDPSGNPLANVTFTLLEDGKEKDRQTTDGTGRATFSGLVEGHKYVIRESVPHGYEPVNDFGPYEISEHDQTISLRIENKKQFVKADGKIMINKIDATDPENKQPMSNVTFNLFLNSNKVASATTNSKGVASFDGLEMNKQYTIEEVVPQGYQDPKPIAPITLTDKDNEVSVTVENHRIPEKHGSITIIKKDATVESNKIPMKNVEFSLYDADKNELVRKASTDERGVAMFEGLKLGVTYRVEETVPQGYMKPTEIDLIELTNANADVTIDVENHKIPEQRGSISIHKVDATDKNDRVNMKDVQFSLYDDATNRLIAKGMSDVNGMVTFNDLKLNVVYRIEETVPDGYMEPKAIDPISLTEGNKAVEIEVENVKIPEKLGSIIINKKDATDPAAIVAMKNVTFKLYDQAKEMIGSATTDEKGVARFDGLKLGVTYTVEEVVPEGYQEPEAIDPIMLSDEKAEVTLHIDNVKIPEKFGTIIINKKDMTDPKNPVVMSDVTFNLFDADHKLVKTAKTNEKGIAMFDGLKLGVAYTIEEIVPEGYKEPAAIKPITLREDKLTVTLAVENVKVPEKLGSITIKKSDSLTGEMMSDVVFTLYDDKGYVIESKKTDGKGIVSFNNLQLGKTYTLKETTPAGYQEAMAIAPITLTKDNADITLEIKNTPLDIRGSIKIVKFDKENDKLLQGAKFALYAYDDKDFSDPIDAASSDAKGEAWFRNLKPGRYVAVEKEAPNGYRLDKKVINIDMRDIVDGAVKTVDFANERLKTKLSIVKHDSKDGNIKVAGAKYGLYTEDMKFIKDGVTDKDGYIDFGEVEFNTTYKIKELSAADNYKLNDHIYTVRTSDLSKNRYEINVEDDPILGSIVIKKVDSRNGDKKLEGAVFTLYYKDDSDFSDPIGSVKTDSNGHAAFNDLRMADYVVKETRAPKDYKKSDSVYYVSVKDLKQGSIEITVKNEPKDPSVPSKPEKPSEPNKPNTPDKPASNNPAPNINTGENGMNILIPAVGLAAGIGCVLYFALSKRKKKKDV